MRRSKTWKPVRDLSLSQTTHVDDVIKQMATMGGFTGRYLAEGVSILEEMCRNKSCKRFLSFPAAPVATGLRGVLKEFIKKKLFDVVITTCGTLDHDLARCWADYFEGDYKLDDEALLKTKRHRLGNVIVPRDSYGPLIESRLKPFFEEIKRDHLMDLSSYELCKRLGAFAGTDDSLLYWANRNNIPVIVPGLTDGAVGSQLWLFSQMERKFKIDTLKDEELLSEMVFTAESTGALMIGGGISKHHTLWWNQFRGGLDYAVYITTAVEYDGSLSGALVREAISWGKVRPKARQVTIHGEATALIPFMAASLLERLSTEQN